MLVSLLWLQAVDVGVLVVLLSLQAVDVGVLVVIAGS